MFCGVAKGVKSKWGSCPNLYLKRMWIVQMRKFYVGKMPNLKSFKCSHNVPNDLDIFLNFSGGDTRTPAYCRKLYASLGLLLRPSD